MRTAFGWSLPPGVTAGMLDALSEDSPCDVCGQLSDTCLCPECPVCGGVGDPTCYPHHGLVRTEAQIASRRGADEAAEAARVKQSE